MADRDIHVSGDSGGTGLGLIAGILLAAVAALLIVFFVSGGIDLNNSKTVDVNIQPPKTELPAGGNAGKPG